MNDPVYNHNSSHESLNILLSSLVASPVSTRVDNQVGVSVGSVGVSVGLAGSVGLVGLDITNERIDPENIDDIRDDANSAVLTNSRSGSFSSEYTSQTSNGSIPNEESTITSFYINENPTDSNTQTMLVGRSRLEYLEYLNENISSIIAEAVKNSQAQQREQW